MAERSLNNVVDQTHAYCIEKVAVDEAERLPREKGSRRRRGRCAGTVGTWLREQCTTRGARIESVESESRDFCRCRGVC